MDAPTTTKTGLDPSLLSLAADIVSAYVSNNALTASDLPTLIKDVYVNIATLATGAVAPPSAQPLVPAVSVKKSVTDEFIICLEDGKKFKSLKRHLSTAFGLSPSQYRAKWGLPADYPMVAPGYASVRSNLAKQAGLGQKAVGRPKSAAKKTAKAAA